MGVDFIDFTILQKKGLIKTEEEKDENEFVDLGSANSGNSGAPNLGFLDSLTGVGNQNSNEGYYGSGSSSNSNSGTDVSVLKLKLEDLEYKLNNIADKLELITSKLINFENKVVK